MRQLMILAAVGLALARPDSYREKEDFQFSRSSTDEGSKSGYYGAQRGNMGGNYERAHNMDPLAQNQMSGLVRTVEGELGSGAKQQTGSVFSSANSRGVYGSGNYDLSNLEGRNFQEGVSYGAGGGGLQSQSLTSHQGSAAFKGQHSASNTAGFSNSQSYNAGGHSQTHDSRYGGYNTAGNSDQALYSSNHQRLDNSQSASQYDSNTALNTGYTAQNSGYYSQAAGYRQGQSYDQGYDQGNSLTHSSNGYGSNVHSRLVSGTPVKIVLRPGTRVLVPVAAQTYDDTQSAALFDQNAINSQAEVFNGNNQQVVQPKPKQYESSYSYRKEWEKHGSKPISGVVPLAVPTVNPYPGNSEFYEDAQAQTLEQQRASGIASQSHHSSHSGYNVKSASSQARQAEYNAQVQRLNSGTNLDSYNGGLTGASDGNSIGVSNLNQVEDSNTKPKSYQSSYSYHKSWERQGDPYVIKPSTNGLYDGQTSGKLIAESLNQGAYGSSNQYGSHHNQHLHQGYSSNSDVDCDENGHTRVARSYNNYQNQEDLGQQTQKQLDKIEDFGQQTQNKWDNLENLQQTQNKWDKVQDDGQQTQLLWGQPETGGKWDSLENLGQQTQSQKDVGQQTQNTWESQTDLGQQTQDGWILEPILDENDGSQTEQKQIGSDSSRQHNHGMNIDNQSHENTFEIVQSVNHHFHNITSHTQEGGTNHHTHTIWDEIRKEEIGQENEDSIETDLTQSTDLGQQADNIWSNANQNDNRYNSWHQESGGRVQADVSKPEQNQHQGFDTPNPHPWMYNQMHHHISFSGSDTTFRQEYPNMNINKLDVNGQTQSSGSSSGKSIMGLWDKLDNIEKQTIPSHETEDTARHVGQDSTTNVDTQDQHSVFDFGNTDNKRIEGSDNVFDSHARHNEFGSQTNTMQQQSNTVIMSSTTLKSTVITEEININNKIRPLDIGRGDIGPEETTNEQTESQQEIKKDNKTQEQIETLSLTKETGNTHKYDVMQENNKKEDEKEFSVLSLDQQNHSEQRDKDNLSRNNDGRAPVTTSTTRGNNYHLMHDNINTQQNNEDEKTRDMDQHFLDQDQLNLDQQTLINQFEDRQENQHQNTDQIMEFGQQMVNIGTEQIEQQFETQNMGQIDNFYQNNKNHEAQDFGQENEQFDQVSLSGWKANENLNQHDHKLENWGQENENLEQQSQSNGWTENIENQKVQTEWKPEEDLQQQSQLTETFEQPIEDLSQQVKPAWKPTEGLQQHTQLTEAFAQPMENLNQQVQAGKEQTEDLQNQNQQTETLPQPIYENNEEIIVPKKVDTIDSPPEKDMVTEKPGFWKSVGSKFTNAKDKVASWFSSS